MNIHPLWFFCLFIRLSIIYVIWYLYKTDNNKYIEKNRETIKLLCFIFVLLIGLGFIRKGYFSSNNEIQIRKVFWHEARYVHGILYILSSLYLLNNNLNISLLLLLLDVIFSVLYRITFDK